MATTYHHGDLRASLVSSALSLLEAGDAPPSLREVARAAGVSAMAPYRHFADRAALLAAVADEGFAALRARLLAADDVADSRAALVAQGRAYVDFALSHPALFRLMFSREKVRGVPEGETAYTVLANRVARIAPDRAEVATLAAWGLVHGLATLLLDANGGTLDRAAVEATLDLLVDGMMSRDA
ncbi:TetR/AcrR family transcriptional regulator [Sphingomonas sp. NFR15]|uniref:TetR/AcrR family transcriptional regulator n=1 Tax=Sphingomonas sp. NFR15 TaxID=1566282 RepID=UPI00088BAAC2|nr:TetR-like C-terminal domain-containing protein [Sphingomonas sp. NFR15]SDA27239.1 transcriptional regulator, TetR family [Sphingomonas sp. NFR15]